MKLAFLFPGQGSQYAGMGKNLYDKYSQAREVFEEADSSLGMNLSSLCFEGPEEELSKTFNAQPAILTVSIAYLRVISSLDSEIVPAGAAGHSLGEYTALVAAGSLAFQDAVRLVRKRGEYMQEAVPLGRGGMAAVMGLNGPEVKEICEKASSKGVVEAVNLNCPGQVVIAGENEALEEACKLTGERGAKRCIPLQVSAPFHSSLMCSAGERLAEELENVEIKDPAIPVVSNVNADCVNTAVEIKEALKKQVYNPVLWQESIEKMINDNYSVFWEIGPGKVLTGLNKKINRRVEAFNMEMDEDVEKVLARVKEVV